MTLEHRQRKSEARHGAFAQNVPFNSTIRTILANYATPEFCACSAAAVLLFGRFILPAEAMIFALVLILVAWLKGQNYRQRNAVYARRHRPNSPEFQTAANDDMDRTWEQASRPTSMSNLPARFSQQDRNAKPRFGSLPD